MHLVPKTVPSPEGREQIFNLIPAFTESQTGFSGTSLFLTDQLWYRQLVVHVGGTRLNTKPLKTQGQ